MKSIKLYAWSTAFITKLNFIRNDQELVTLRKIGAAQAFANFTWSTTPFLVSCSTFAVFVFTKDTPLTTDIVFPALTLFNLLTFPLAVLPLVITSVVEASVAVERLTSFLLADELQQDAVLMEPVEETVGKETVRVQGATFTWNKDEGKNALEDITLSVRKGDLACVVGRVGAGKSSLLQSMLGELWKIRGTVILRGRTAYVAQSSWVMNASVRDNIVFGHRWDPQFYDRTVKACALSDDFSSLPDGDQTEVGEKGISLSGGQKARLTLARAVYARADIYLLDDVLSAVDQHVGRHLIDNILGPNGLLAHKTRILATNSIPILKEANLVTMLRGGRIIESGTFDQLMAKKGEVANLVRTANNDEPSSEEESRETGSTDSEETVYASNSDDELAGEDAPDELAQLAPVEPKKSATRKYSTATLRRASTASFRGPRGKVTDEEENGNIKSKQSQEFSEQGKVKWSVYIEYAKTSNLAAVGVYLVTLIASQTASIGKFTNMQWRAEKQTDADRGVGGSIWLKEWSETNGEYGGNPDVAKYIGIYLAFGVGSSALAVIQTLILWIFCSIEVSFADSKLLHCFKSCVVFLSRP